MNGDVEVFEQMVRTMNILSYRTVHSEVHTVHTYTVQGAMLLSMSSVACSEVT